MMVKNEKLSPCLKARQGILELIRGCDNIRHFPLPSERKLCEMFSLSRVTIRRVIASLIKENIITNIHGRGNFVTKKMNVQTAIILSDGEQNQVIENSSSFAEIIQHFDRKQHRIRILSLQKPDQALSLCRNFTVKTLFWFNPPKNALPALKKIIDSGELAVVAFAPRALGYPSPEKFDYHNFFLPDRSLAGRLKAEYIIARKAGKIAYLGSKGATYSAFCKTMAEAGFPQSPEWIIEHEIGLESKLEAFFMKNDFDFIVSDGGDRYAHLFSFLSVNNKYANIPILAVRTPYFDILCKKYREINIAATGSFSDTLNLTDAIDRLCSMKPGDKFPPVYNTSYVVSPYIYSDKKKLT